MAANDGIAKVFGENLKAHRARLRLSQETLGRLAGLHRTEIALLENAERTARIDTLIKLSSSLETTPNDLLDRIDWVPRWPHHGEFVIANRHGWLSPTHTPS